MKSCKSFFLNSLGALALACAVSGNAGAVNVNLGDLTDTNFVQAYSYAQGTVVNDVFHFDLTSPSSFNAVLNQTSFAPIFNISGFSLALTLPTGPTLHFGPAGSIIWTDLLLLSPGNNFTMQVSGLANGSFGGSYSIVMNAVANAPQVPIPEPAEWLLMLGGLAVLTGAVRRGARRSGGPLAA